MQDETCKPEDWVSGPFRTIAQNGVDEADTLADLQRRAAILTQVAIISALAFAHLRGWNGVGLLHSQAHDCRQIMFLAWFIVCLPSTRIAPFLGILSRALAPYVLFTNMILYMGGGVKMQFLVSSTRTHGQNNLPLYHHRKANLTLIERAVCPPHPFFCFTSTGRGRRRRRSQPHLPLQPSSGKRHAASFCGGKSRGKPGIVAPAAFVSLPEDQPLSTSTSLLMLLGPFYGIIGHFLALTR